MNVFVNLGENKQIFKVLAHLSTSNKQSTTINVLSTSIFVNIKESKETTDREWLILKKVFKQQMKSGRYRRE